MRYKACTLILRQTAQVRSAEVWAIHKSVHEIYTTHTKAVNRKISNERRRAKEKYINVRQIFWATLPFTVPFRANRPQARLRCGQSCAQCGQRSRSGLHSLRRHGMNRKLLS